MFWLSLLLASLTIFSVFPSVLAGVIPRRSQCQATLNDALIIAAQLQGVYWDRFGGEYNGGGLWSDANTLEDIYTLMLVTGYDDWADPIETSYIASAALNPDTDWDSFLSGSFDDAQWVILALWKIADYQAARGQDNAAYLSSAASIYGLVSRQWDNKCGGGIWWSWDYNFKNTITTELFLLTSAEGYLRYKNEIYLGNAKTTWAWLSASGLRGTDGLFNDGLDPSSCRNNDGPTWTYNQAVVASGLGALYASTGDSSLLDQAEISLDATISQKTSNGILKESCDDASSTNSPCNDDQQLFKGIWTKHLQYYLDYANDPKRTAKYSAFLDTQYTAVMRYGKNINNDIGSVWYAPDSGGSLWRSQASASGLEAIMAAAKYGQC